MRSLIALLVLCSIAVGQEPVPVPKIDPPSPWLIVPVLPTVDTVVTPQPGPVLPPSPDTPPVLPPRTLYVLQSDTKFFLLASPADLVSIRLLPGPRDISGVFADSAGKDEDRTYSRPFVAVVKAVEGKSGRVELIGVSAGGIDNESSITRILIDIGAAPQPPPPGPVDPPDPEPVVVVPTGFRVMFVYDTAANLTTAQQSVLYSPAITKYLTDKCVKSDSGIPEWRKWSKDVVVSDRESKTIAAMWTALKPTLGPLPQLAIHANGQGHVFPLPATEAEALALLKKYGGE